VTQPSAWQLVNTKTRYLKKVDSFQNNHIHTFLTGGNVKFMLLMNADPLATPYSNFASPPPSRSTSARQSTLIANNPSSSQTEDAVRGFVTEVSLLYRHDYMAWRVYSGRNANVYVNMQVYEAWVKCTMNPFYDVNQEITSPIFRSRVAAAAKRFL
jgi:hypothetical protein